MYVFDVTPRVNNIYSKNNSIRSSMFGFSTVYFNLQLMFLNSFNARIVVEITLTFEHFRLVSEIHKTKQKKYFSITETHTGKPDYCGIAHVNKLIN